MIVAPGWVRAESSADFKEARARSKGDKDVDAATDSVDADGRSPIDGVKGHVGLGYFTDFAPLGIRYWSSRTTGFDLGFNGAYSNGDQTGYHVAVEVGSLFVLGHYHYSVAFARLGLGYGNGNTGERGAKTRSEINANVFLGAELFLGALGFPNVSLQGGYGVQATWTMERGSKFLIGAANPGLSVVGSGIVGFHIYI